MIYVDVWALQGCDIKEIPRQLFPFLISPQLLLYNNCVAEASQDI